MPRLIVINLFVCYAPIRMSQNTVGFCNSCVHVNAKVQHMSDVILLQGALGFSGSGVQLEAKKDGPALMA